MEEDRRYAEADDEREERGGTMDDVNDVDHCFFATLARSARALSESAPSTQGTSTDVKRTHPVSVW
jgi:hypothetical protein